QIRAVSNGGPLAVPRPTRSPGTGPDVMSTTSSTSGPDRDGERLLLTLEDAARALSIGRTTLYRLLGNGALASCRVGRARRVHIAELREFAQRLALGEVET